MRSIFRPASLVATVGKLSFLAVIAGVFAFLREVVLASTFGAGASVDAYLVAVAVPFVLCTATISTLEAAFIPIYLQCKASGGSERATHFAAGAHLGMLLLGAGLTVALYAALPILVPLQAPGFSASRLAEVRTLSLFTCPSVLFACLHCVGRSVLNAERRFLPPALSPTLAAVVTIAVMVLGRPILGVRAMAAAYTAGMIAFWLAVYLPLMVLRLPGRTMTANWWNADVRALLRNAVPLAIGVVTSSGIVVVDRMMASSFPDGVISGLAYADRVIQVPLAIVATAVGTALFPALSDHAARRDLGGLRRTFGRGAQLIVMVLVPAAALLVVLSPDVVRVLFERGRFTASDSVTTAVALSALAWGLALAGVLQLVPRVFNALQLTWVVGLSGLLNLVFKTVFNLLLVPWFGYVGFALATSAMYAGTGAVMLLLLRGRLHGLRGSGLVSSVCLALGGAVPGAIVAAAMVRWLGISWPIARLAAGGATGTAVYAGVVYAVTSGNPAAWLRRSAARGEPTGVY